MILNRATGMEDASRTGGSRVSALTRAMAEADESAFREFHTAWFGRLFSYVMVLMRGDEHAARDVAQETLLRVVRHAKPFDDEKHFWDWLTRLARSAAADHGRRASRYQRLLAAFGLHRKGRFDEDSADDSTLDALLEQGLSELTTEERELLGRKYEQGLSVRELADAAGVTEEAIESRLARARRALRELVFRRMRKERKEAKDESI